MKSTRPFEVSVTKPSAARHLRRDAVRHVRPQHRRRSDQIPRDCHSAVRIAVTSKPLRVFRRD